jgi:hypothetical protein
MSLDSLSPLSRVPLLLFASFGINCKCLVERTFIMWHVWRWQCKKQLQMLPETKNGKTCSCTLLRHCNAHYNNFQYENAFDISKWQLNGYTLFNSLKVHINKTTCARVLSVNTTLNLAIALCPFKINNTAIPAGRSTRYYVFILCLVSRESLIVYIEKKWKRRRKKYLN